MDDHDIKRQYDRDIAHENAAIMTPRFVAACFALAGLLANPNLTRAKDISQARNCDAGNALLAPVVNIEECAVQLADHLLAALNKPE